MNWPLSIPILKSWHQKGLHTGGQIQAGESSRPRPAANAPPAYAHTPGEADHGVQEDLERMRDAYEPADRRSQGRVSSWHTTQRAPRPPRPDGGAGERGRASRRAGRSIESSQAARSTGSSATCLDIVAASLRRGDDPAPAIEEVRRRQSGRVQPGHYGDVGTQLLRGL